MKKTHHAARRVLKATDQTGINQKFYQQPCKRIFSHRWLVLPCKGAQIFLTFPSRVSKILFGLINFFKSRFTQSNYPWGLLDIFCVTVRAIKSRKTRHSNSEFLDSQIKIGIFLWSAKLTKIKLIQWWWNFRKIADSRFSISMQSFGPTNFSKNAQLTKVLNFFIAV